MQSAILAAAWTARALSLVHRDLRRGGTLVVLSVDFCAAAVGAERRT